MLLRAVIEDLGEGSASMSDVKVDAEAPLIDTMGKTRNERLKLLSKVGLIDAFLFVCRYSNLVMGSMSFLD